MGWLSLYPHQKEALPKIHNGCILNGGVGSGKSRTSLAYYFQQCGGELYSDKYKKMTKPLDLYIITTAKKRDDEEWEDEMTIFLMSTNPELMPYNHKIVVDSWNNIKKYRDVTNAFFIFDEDRVTGTGAWVKHFWKICKSNQWILLSATPGATWADYGPVFVANGFYRNITEFRQEHVTYKPYSNFPQIDHQRYRNVGRLVRLRRKILIPMDFERHTVRHDEYILCDYDSITYKQICKTRTNPFNAMYPIQNASEFCQALRRVVNSSDSRKLAVLEIMDKKPKAIIFYNYDYELEGLIKLCEDSGIDYAQWNGHKHEEIPKGDKWMYLVQYNAGSEGWNYVGTDIIIFYSLNYSYKMTEQASGRIDRLNTPFTDLYYYHLMSRSGIDMAILKALKGKKKFNEGSYCKGMDFDTATGKVPFAS